MCVALPENRWHSSLPCLRTNWVRWNCSGHLRPRKHQLGHRKTEWTVIIQHKLKLQKLWGNGHMGGIRQLNLYPKLRYFPGFKIGMYEYVSWEANRDWWGEEVGEWEECTILAYHMEELAGYWQYCSRKCCLSMPIGNLVVTYILAHTQTVGLERTRWRKWGFSSHIAWSCFPVCKWRR